MDASSSCLQLLSTDGHWSCSSANQPTWLVSSRAQAACNLTNAAFPRVHSVDWLQAQLRGRWLFIVGDSSARMLMDYAAMRLTGGSWLRDGRLWPTTRDQFGPKRPRRCRLTNQASRGDGCFYDDFVAGTRLTFVWHPHAALSHSGLNETLYESILSRAAGWPDYLIIENGPWDNGEGLSANRTKYPQTTLGWSSTQEHWVRRTSRAFDCGAGGLVADAPHAFRPPVLVWMDGPEACGAVGWRGKLFLNASAAFLRSLDPDPQPWLHFARSAFRYTRKAHLCLHYADECRLSRHHPTGELLATSFDALVFGLAKQERHRPPACKSARGPSAIAYNLMTR
jgi:hypothetical protein